MGVEVINVYDHDRVIFNYSFYMDLFHGFSLDFLGVDIWLDRVVGRAGERLYFLF